MNYFVTAIGTDSGKTVVSALLVEMLEADYWKPVQAGFPTDTDTVKGLISNSKSKFYQERYLLETPASPHAAAEIESIQIGLDDFTIPETNNHLIMEGAGGLLVPLNYNDTILDLIKKLGIEVILVSNLYLGSINHTLLSCEVLKKRDIPVRGIIFNGESNPASQKVIEQISNYEVLFHLPDLESVTKEFIQKTANSLKKEGIHERLTIPR